MPYVTRAQITAKIPPNLLAKALDDNGDSAEDDGLLEQVIAVASLEVDGFLRGLFAVPFADPAPAKVQQAAFALVCEAIYQRRNVPAEQNPFTPTAKWWRTHLQAVGNRELPFAASQTPAVAPGAATTEPNRLNESFA